MRGTRHCSGTRSESASKRSSSPIDEIFAIEVQDVEHKRRERQRCPQALDVQPTAEPTGADLKRMRPAILAQGNGLAIQDDGLDRQCAAHLHQLGDARGDVVQAAGEDANVAAEHVDLDPRAVELPFDGGWRDALEAAAMLVADCASIGSTGRPTCSLNALSPATPSRNTASATARRSPLSMTARRTSAIGICVAFASASSTIPSWAPWRSSPISSRTRKPCSGSVALAKSAASCLRRSACDAGPARRPIASSSPSTSTSEREAFTAGGGWSRMEA